MKHVKDYIEKAASAGEFGGKIVRKIFTKTVMLTVAGCVTIIFGAIFLIYGFVIGATKKHGIDPHMNI
jgi:hypothetical protein